jgi:hypothetical protein
MKNSLEWHRSKVQELASQGHNLSEISRILQISQPTINRDITYLRQQAKDDIKRYIDERQPNGNFLDYTYICVVIVVVFINMRLSIGIIIFMMESVHIVNHMGKNPFFFH